MQLRALTAIDRKGFIQGTVARPFVEERGVMREMRLEDPEGQPSNGSVKHGRGLDLILSEMGVTRGS